MGVSAPPRSGDRAGARRANAGVGLTFDVIILLMVNAWPGWEAVPFLTPAFASVLPWVNASLVVGCVANALVVVTGSTAVKAVGDAAVMLAGLASVLRLWQVFPFDLTLGWQVAFRLFLGLGLLGSVIGFLVALVKLVKLTMLHATRA